MLNKTAAALLLFTALIISCSKEGTFAWKTFDKDSYRLMSEPFEFSAAEPFDWVYTFSKKPGRKKITVITQKKEVVWVEVKKETQMTEKESPYVHGRVEGMEPGEYEIVIVNDNKAEARKNFTLYNPELPRKED